VTRHENVYRTLS